MAVSDLSGLVHVTEMKDVMRWKFQHTLYKPNVYIFTPDAYNVAWHIRTGDIQLHAGDVGWFRRVHAQVCVGLSHC
jgi:hypothetical protein